ncbi:aconitase X [Streptomyces sp. TRM68367]|uniref:aconitase X n=1 Tax=Streptomyces sp. TRM68367 TaxID=2758415 RepID=UPI0029342B45|nr:aconitase X [Streptomyces sp. TRM68367]
MAVRTTLNVGSLDLLHPGLVRGDAALADGARRLMDAYVALGCEPTWSCAPYQLSHRPAFGAHVAWAESNAIAFVNSVLGTRTDRYGDFVDIAAALTGRVPASGLHLDSERRLVLDCSAIREDLWERLRDGTAPAALVLAPCDKILVVGALVAAELYDVHLPIVQADADAITTLAGQVSVTAHPCGEALVRTIDG